MIYYAIFVTLWLGLPILGVWPPVKHNSDGSTNGMLFITMRPREYYPAHNQVYEAVFAQEIAEWWLKWAVAFVLAAPVMYMFKFHLATVLVPMLAYCWKIPLIKQLEYIGHAVEVLVGEDTLPNYLTIEADKMRRTYEGMFADDIEAELQKRFGVAKTLIAILARPIRREA